MAFPGTAPLLPTLLVLASAVHAQVEPAVYFSVPPVDAPELAHRGQFPVGVRTLEIVNPGQPDILQFNRETGKAPLTDRKLTLEVWYPAILPADVREHTLYEMSMPGSGPSRTFLVPGKALRDASPVAGKLFPLVVLSHGYPGSRIFLSYLGENLASKGYVVASIDHIDSVLGAVRGFPSTLLNRSTDQLFTLDALAAMGRQPGHFLAGLVDADRAAIVGYSMGGYGALASGGAGYSKSGSAARLVPGGYFEGLIAGNPQWEARRRPGLKVIVAIAPWGNQPPNNNWDADGLAGLRLPSLFIAGDQDDVSGFELGTRKVFTQAVNSKRCLLVYENANHNVGGNPPPPEALSDFSTRAFFEEPVWRKDRLAAINQHFITAFLDVYLKGDEGRREYLQLAVEKSNEGKWPLQGGTPAGASYSPGPGRPGLTYWKGFQRRWALGMELYCADPGEVAPAHSKVLLFRRGPDGKPMHCVKPVLP